MVKFLVASVYYAFTDDEEFKSLYRADLRVTLRGAKYAAAGATAGSVLGPVGTGIGGVGGFIYGVVSAVNDHKEKGDTTWSDVGKEAVSTATSLKGKFPHQ